MHHCLFAVQPTQHRVRIRHISRDHFHMRGKILCYPQPAGVYLGQKTIQNRNLVPLMEKVSRQMCADKTRSSCDQYLHFS
jgi:hypothetical protein